MKFPLIIFFACAALASAAEFRTWTESASKRTIEGIISDKKSDNSSVKITTRDNKTIWIETANLAPVDQEYIRKWVGSPGRLTVRVIATGKGWKELKVSYQSGALPLKVEGHDTWPNRKKGPIRRQIKAGQTGEFTYKAYNEYRVIASSEGKEIDRQTDKSKTGL